MRTTVLLPVDLHASIKAIADEDRRSMHQEIIYALERFAAERQQEPSGMSEKVVDGIIDSWQPKQ